ncbi:DUF397 domain-containing protein [Kineosporia mesophila]|uniref:DUF397 domain-containing protein n=1 Tax=Kineosporia mesophila TaxID=566012 RepID=UPI0031EB6BBA
MVGSRNEVRFRTSSFSAEEACVEVGADGRGVLVRQSKDRSAGHLSFTDREWRAFVAGVKAGEFDLDDAGDLKPC